MLDVVDLLAPQGSRRVGGCQVADPTGRGAERHHQVMLP